MEKKLKIKLTNSENDNSFFITLTKVPSSL